MMMSIRFEEFFLLKKKKKTKLNVASLAWAGNLGLGGFDELLNYFFFPQFFCFFMS